MLKKTIFLCLMAMFSFTFSQAQILKITNNTCNEYDICVEFGNGCSYAYTICNNSPILNYVQAGPGWGQAEILNTGEEIMSVTIIDQGNSQWCTTVHPNCGGGSTGYVAGICSDFNAFLTGNMPYYDLFIYQ